MKLWHGFGTLGMARKKKVKRFRAVQAVKELARERMGAPPAEKVVPHKIKSRKAQTHAGQVVGRERVSRLSCVRSN